MDSCNKDEERDEEGDSEDASVAEDTLYKETGGNKVLTLSAVEFGTTTCNVIVRTISVHLTRSCFE